MAIDREETRKCPTLKKLVGDGEINIVYKSWSNQNGSFSGMDITCPYITGTGYCEASRVNGGECTYYVRGQS